MALIKPGAMIGQISGKLGSHVFAHNRGGPYVRLGTIPTVVTSSYAQAVKNALAAASQSWQTLNTGQQLAWKTWASQNPIINRLGEPRILSGHQAFIQLNQKLLLYALTPISVPPVAAPPTALLTLTGSYDIGAGDFQIAFTATPLDADIALLVRAAVVDSSGIAYVRNRLKLITKSAAALASPLDTTTAMTARFGALAVGQHVFYDVRTFDQTTGLESAPLQANGTIVST